MTEKEEQIKNMTGVEALAMSKKILASDDPKRMEYYRLFWKIYNKYHKGGIVKPETKDDTVDVVEYATTNLGWKEITKSVKKKTLKQFILEYLKEAYPNIVHKGELDKLGINEWGYESETVGRTCRTLENKGIIKRYLDSKGMAMYQYNQSNYEGNKNKS